MSIVRNADVLGVKTIPYTALKPEDHNGISGLDEGKNSFHKDSGLCVLL